VDWAHLAGGRINCELSSQLTADEGTAAGDYRGLDYRSAINLSFRSYANFRA